MNMKNYWPLSLLLLATNCSGQEHTSSKQFPEIALTNRITFTDPHFDQPRFGCGFLLVQGPDTFAITAKHLLKFIKTREMTRLTLGNSVKSWWLFSLPNKEKTVVAQRLLNENPAASLDDKAIYEEDWLVFSTHANRTSVKPLVFRTTPLRVGEKLYVVGWTRHMEAGPQRVYEFEYYKTVDHRLLLKDVVVPEQFGGLSGAPLVDEQGDLVGIVSGGTVDPVSKQKYFAPCPVDGLRAFIENYQKKQ